MKKSIVNHRFLVYLRYLRGFVTVNSAKCKRIVIICGVWLHLSKQPIRVAKIRRKITSFPKMKMWKICS